jgi:SAM-dependent methyltransferase
MNKKGYTKRTECASCSNPNLHTIYDFGKVPLAGFFPTQQEKDILSSYPLKFQICNNCSLVQTDSIIDANILFKDYRYISSIGMQNHFNQYTEWLITKENITPNTKILEFGCNDGPLLWALKEKGINATGIDPASNIIKLGKDKGLDIIEDFFNAETSIKNNWISKYDYILSSNSFAHITDIQSVVKGVKLALKPKGKFIVEVQYLVDLIDKFQFDFIYHEHLYYYTLTSLNNLLLPHGLCIIDFERIPIHSGSIRVIIGKCQEHKVKSKVYRQIQNEKSHVNLDDFGLKIQKSLTKLRSFFEGFKSNTIIGYGASGRANMLVNTLKLTTKNLKCIIDESPERYNRYIANQEIPIIPLEKLDIKPDYIFILAWNFAQPIMQKTKHLKIPYIIPFPELRIIQP